MNDDTTKIGRTYFPDGFLAMYFLNKDALPEHIRKVLTMRIKQGMTLKAIGEKFSTSPERVRQIESHGFSLLLRYYRNQEAIIESQKGIMDKYLTPNQKLDSDSIEELELSARTQNALVNNEIRTIGQLAKMSDSELRDLKGFGNKAREEAKEAVSVYIEKYGATV
jgi:DNA-directed RNA polymerase alpha subunit